MDERLSVVLIAALAGCWSAIRANHPDVPGVVLLPAPVQRGGMNVLGHFAPIRWKAKKTGEVLLHEVVVVAEHLDRHAADIFETLLHEASHARNFAAGIHDCSPTSQYHNAKFKVAAEKLGLEVAKVPHYGWAFTMLRVATRDQYANEIAALEAVLVHRRKPTMIVIPPSGPLSSDQTPTGGNDGEDDSTKCRSRKATCSCTPPFIIRVSKKVMDATTIRCDSCGEPFCLA